MAQMPAVVTTSTNATEVPEEASEKEGVGHGRYRVGWRREGCGRVRWQEEVEVRGVACTAVCKQS